MREAQAADVVVALAAAAAAGGGTMAATEAKDWHPPEGLLVCWRCCLRVLDVVVDAAWGPDCRVTRQWPRPVGQSGNTSHEVPGWQSSWF